MNAVPSFDMKRQHEAIRAELDEALRRVVDSGWYILGPEVEAFEREFAAYVGTAHCIGVASGTDALTLAVRAAGVGAGDEVITVSHTAVATVAAIEMAGATPVLVDIDDRSYTIDAAQVERAITPRTRAIIPVHLYGQAADMDALMAVAKAHGLTVIEDCAQAHGARYKGRMAGTFGALATFSFYPTKNLGALGDGGAVVTNDAGLAERVRLLRQYGWRERYVSAISGMNSRLDEMQAAVLRVKLRHLDEWNAARRRIAAVYTAALENVVPPAECAGRTHVYHLYVIRSARRDALMASLKSRGIGTAIHYPLPVHLQPAYKAIAPPTGLPVTERIGREILSLPMYPELRGDEVDAVAAAVRHAIVE
ncbi:DegT/DnrJ/EryC1/StrS family aminotransferase [bacterium]|nr:DegT/DnrJ/EryC1/StrS family aminotransferase [bacterium]